MEQRKVPRTDCAGPLLSEQFLAVGAYLERFVSSIPGLIIQYSTYGRDLGQLEWDSCANQGGSYMRRRNVPSIQATVETRDRKAPE